MAHWNIQCFEGNKKGEKVNYFKIIFPVLMVIGALGSLIVNVINKGDGATSLQWLGAMLLYTALTFRNVG